MRRVVGWAARLAIVAVAAASSACFEAEVDLVRDHESVRALGPGFIHDDFFGQTRTTFTWDAGRRGYVDQKGETLIRLGHLSGAYYLAQAQPLKGPEIDPELRARVAAADLERATRMRIYGLVQLSPPRVHLQSPTCLATTDSREAIAAHLGVGIRDRPMATGLTGTREALLGFLLAGVRCRDQGNTDIRILAETLEPGGEELAAQAAKPDPANVVAFLEPRCDHELRACYRLGQVLTRGRGVARDPARAAALFERVCAKDVRACVDLAQLLQQGDGVPRDAVRAATILAKACEDGEPYACELRAAAPR